MATLLNDEVDPYAKYLVSPASSVTVGPAIGYENAKPISTPKVNTGNLTPDLQTRIKQLADLYKADIALNPKGEDLPITSGYRTREQQRQLYLDRLKNPNLVAEPGKSRHETGAAFDLHPRVPNALLEQVGLYRPHGSKDMYHVEINPKANFQPMMASSNDEIDPYSSYLKEQGVYEPSTRQVIGSQFAEIRKNLGSSDYYTKTFPKQAAALGDVIYGAVPAAVKFVGEPFAKLADKLGNTNVAMEALNKVTQFAERPIGKAFGITNDPAYNAEAANRMIDYVGQNMDKGADYIAKETGLPKSDVAWFMNAAMIAAAPAAARGAKKSYEIGKEVATEAVTQGKQVVGTAKEALQNRFESLRPAEDLAGRSVGAAELPAAQLRKQRGAELPFPIDYEKSQLTRHPADVRFARETTKDPVFGQQFQEMYAKQNALIQRNLDQFIVDTGATLSQAQPSTVGAILRSEVKAAKKTAKDGVDTSYQIARDAGELAELVNANPLKKYVDGLEAEAINAPIITSAQIKLKNLLDKEGGISLNNIEEVRKMVGRLSKDSASNAHYAKEINGLIDKITEGKGGDLYKDARAKNTAYMNEFQDMPVMQTILNTKRGTKQHTTAVADLVEQVMIKGSAEDVTNLFNTLSKRGDAGKELINELKGSVAQRIKDQATKGVQRDINGLPYVETKSLDTIINQLDKSDKLDLLFGKKGAEYYRTINDATKDLQTIPKETTNPSGSASSIMAAMGALGAEAGTNAMISGGYFPVPVATGAALIGKHMYGKKVAKEKMNKISDFINYSKEIP